MFISLLQLLTVLIVKPQKKNAHTDVFGHKINNNNNMTNTTTTKNQKLYYK